MTLMMKTPSMGAREWGLMVGLSVVWAGSFFFFKILVTALPPFTIVLGRVSLAALTLHLVLMARGETLRIPFIHWPGFMVIGLLNNVIPFALIAFAEARISSGTAAIINATSPIFTILVAHVLTADEKLTWIKSAGVLLGFAGVAVLIGPAPPHAAGGGSLAGDAACLLASMIYGFGAVYSRRFRTLPPIRVATGQLSASICMVLPLALLIDQPWRLPMPGLSAWAALVGLAVPSTALAYLLFFRIMAVAGATNAMLVTLLVPVGSLMLGALFLGEPITLPAVGGMALIASGLAAIDGRMIAVLRRGLNAS